MEFNDVKNIYIFSKEVDRLILQYSQARVSFSCSQFDLEPNLELMNAIKLRVKELAPDLDLDSSNPLIQEALDLCLLKLELYNRKG